MRAFAVQCDIGTFDDCFAVNANGSLGAALAAGFDYTGFELVPGVLHAYKASAADVSGLVRPHVPGPRD